MEITATNNSVVEEEERQRIVGTVQIIVIRLGDEQYGVDISSVDNIAKLQPVTRIPKMPHYLKGVINYRGEVLPVMSMRRMMGLEDDVITKNSRIIVLKLGQEGNVGFVVDEVKEVVTISMDEIEKTPYNANDERANLVNAVGKHNGELISLIDLNALSLDGDHM